MPTPHPFPFSLPSDEFTALRNTLETALNLCYFTNQCEGDGDSIVVCSKGNSAAHSVAEMACRALGLKTKGAVYLFVKAGRLHLMDEGSVDSLDLPRL